MQSYNLQLDFDTAAGLDLATRNPGSCREDSTYFMKNNRSETLQGPNLVSDQSVNIGT